MKYGYLFIIGLFIISVYQKKVTSEKIEVREVKTEKSISTQKQEAPTQNVGEDVAVENILPDIDCSSQEITIKLAFPNKNPENRWEREINLPLTGKFTEESHFVTDKDSFDDARLFANGKDENIDSHLERSYEIYKKYDSTLTFQNLYAKWWQKVWTPSEGGEIGQGSVGKVQVNELSPAMEMWFLNMMWAPGQRPARGTKFILEYDSKHIVVIAGYETGPADKKFVGGVTREVHAFLGTNPNSDIKISLLKYQNSPIGPVKCKS